MSKNIKNLEALLIEVLRQLEFVKKVSKRGVIHYELTEPLKINGKRIFISVYEEKEAQKKETIKLSW